VDARLDVEHWDGSGGPQELARRLVNHRADAILVPPPLCDDGPLLEALASTQMPFAQIASGSPVAGVPAVSICDEAAAHAMTVHLLGLGHKRIGFIAGNSNQTASAQRLAGYERALRAVGLTPADALVVPGDFTYRSGFEATEKLLSQTPRPTAIFASNDDMAAAAIAAAHRHGLDVPRDLSVCGFDDTAMARTIWPEITTIRQPIAEMARRATIRLAEIVRGKLTPEGAASLHEIVDFELVIRASDAAPSAEA
jgi:LacI family transcriptional regulator